MLHLYDSNNYQQCLNVVFIVPMGSLYDPLYGWCVGSSGFGHRLCPPNLPLTRVAWSMGLQAVCREQSVLCYLLYWVSCVLHLLQAMGS